MLQRAMAGDPGALDALWREHRRWVGAVLLAHMPRDGSLEDLLQEVALVLVERVRDLRDPGGLRPWLRSVAVNAARTAGRRRSVRGPVADPSARPEPDDGCAGARRAETRETLDQVLALARGLHPDYREPLLLRSLQGLSQADIAATLGLPETTVETRLARARRLLRNELQRDDDRPIPGRARRPSRLRA